MDKLKQVMHAHDADKESIRRAVLSQAQKPAGFARKLQPALAAILAVLVLSSVTFYAAAAEGREYRAAMVFFNDNHISTEGMTRTEIKAVYRDVTQKTYSYDKTLEILNQYSVQEYNTQLGSLTPEQLNELWEERLDAFMHSLNTHTGIWYDVKYHKDAQDVGAGRYLICYDGSQELWQTDLPDGYEVITPSMHMIPFADGVVIFGLKGTSVSCKGYPAAMLISREGKLLWEYIGNEEGVSFSAGCVSRDGIALFGGGLGGTQFTLINMNGERITQNQLDFGSVVYFRMAIALKDRYLVQYISAAESQVLSVSRDGKPMEALEYRDGNVAYVIKDMIAVGDKVYLSTLKQDPGFDTHFRQLMNHSEEDDFCEQITTLFQQERTAVLLETDASGTISQAYSANGALPGKLTRDENNRLCWQVLRYDRATPAPLWINSCFVNLDCTEFSFVFSSAGILLNTEEIGYFASGY